MSSMRK